MPLITRSSVCSLLALLMLCACGRLGFELHELDAGAEQSQRGATGTPARNTGQAGKGGMDAGISATDALGSLPGAWINNKDSGKAPGLENAAACSGDDMCQSGACVDGICCESHCDAPPQCYIADGASCPHGYCLFKAAADGSACDDANSCSKDDMCNSGSCSGRAECEDDNSCTADFCAADGCSHASSCEAQSRGDMPCSYAQRLGHGYWLCPASVSFDAALSECKRIGAKLVTIDNESEQAALWQLGMRDTWIGYRAVADRDNDAGFDWVDGDSSFEDWAQERRDDSDEDAGAGTECAYLAASQQGAWRSHACDDKRAGFACEIEQYAPPEASCSYQRRGSHGYFRCSERRTWLDAAERCASSGAYLVELDDAEEQAFVVSLLDASNEDARYAIGVTDAKQEGTFQTIRGGALRFTAWKDGEPSTADDFVVLAADGTWQSVGSAEQSNYICEQER